MKKIFYLLLFFVVFTPAAASAAVDVSLPFLGGPYGLSNNTSSSSIAGYIANLYQFGIGISGILAVGMIVAGAILYSTSAGQGDKQKEGKEMITSALWGIVLLFGAYLILKTINPDLTSLREPNAPIAEQLTNSSSTPPNLVPLPSNIPTNGKACSGTCMVNKDLIFFINKLVETVPKYGAGAWYVTEAYPPTVVHKSGCHNQGTCIDTALQNKNPTCDEVQKFLNAVTASGFGMANEYYKCPNTNPPPQKYDTTTGQNVHVFY